MINFSDAALCLKTLAHPDRLEIVYHLIEKKKACVSEIAALLSLESNVVSEHLTLMKDRDLLHSKREGRKVYYSIAEPSLINIMECIKRKFN